MQIPWQTLHSLSCLGLTKNRRALVQKMIVLHYSPLKEISSFSSAQKRKETDFEAILKLDALDYSNSQG
jgi:hypothetical protein